MKKTLPIGKDDFKKLIDENCYYVDKTKVIEELIKNKFETVLFPRPRRFGKSLFISMLENFFDIEKKDENKNLFKGLNISKSKVYKDNLNKYPVIHLDFKDMKSSTFESTLYAIKDSISKLYKNKNYILEKLDDDEKKYYQRIEYNTASIDDYKKSISNLCLWLERYYNEKVIVLIDEYDTPMDSGYNNRYYEKIMEIIQPMFSNAFKGNGSLKMGVMTGVLRVGGESLFSAFNNPMIYDVMTPGYSEYFGFTEKETKELLEYYGLELTSNVKEYYNGYNFNSICIYNPWSILNYCLLKELRPYWVNTGSNTLIRECLKSLDEIDKSDLEDLILGHSLSFNYEPKLSYGVLRGSNFNSVLNLMLVSGYLTLDYREEGGYTYYKIPNNEVKKDLSSILSEIEFGGDVQNRRETKKFIESLIDNDKSGGEQALNLLMESASHHDNRESFYHGYVLSIFDTFISQDKYLVDSNRESGFGRSDILIRRKDCTLGIIIELKYSKTLKGMETEAKNGLEQLKTKEYKMDFKREGIDTVNEFVIVFHGRKAIVR